MTIYVHYNPVTGEIESFGNCVHSMHRTDLSIIEIERQPDVERQKIDVATGNLIERSEQEIAARAMLKNEFDVFLINGRANQ
jgi:hypothetical protein